MSEFGDGDDYDDDFYDDELEFKTGFKELERFSYLNVDELSKLSNLTPFDIQYGNVRDLSAALYKSRLSNRDKFEVLLKIFLLRYKDVFDFDFDAAKPVVDRIKEEKIMNLNSLLFLIGFDIYQKQYSRPRIQYFFNNSKEIFYDENIDPPGIIRYMRYIRSLT
jgi:hypothetical protein